MIQAETQSPMPDAKAQRAMSHDAKMVMALSFAMMGLMVVRVVQSPWAILAGYFVAVGVIYMRSMRHRREHGWRWRRPEPWRVGLSWFQGFAGVAFYFFLMSVVGPKDLAREASLTDRILRNVTSGPWSITSPVSMLITLWIVNIAVLNVLTTLRLLPMRQLEFEEQCKPQRMEAEPPRRPPTSAMSGVTSSPWWELLALLASAGFVMSAVVNVVAWVSPEVLPRMPPFVLLPGVFVVWIPTIFSLRHTRSGTDQLEALKRVFDAVPGWMKLVVPAAVVWTAVNFMISTNGEAGAQPARMFSGHAMTFYGVAMAVLHARNRGGILDS